MRFVILTLALAVGISLLDQQQHVSAHPTDSLEKMVFKRGKHHHGHNQHHKHPKPSHHKSPPNPKKGKGKPPKGPSKGPPKDDHHHDKDDKHHKDDHHGKNGKDHNGDQGSAGLLHQLYKGFECPNPQASKDRPNGAVKFLNCGLHGGGWKPPPVKLSDLKMIAPKDAVHGPVFKPCGKYLDIFQKVAAESHVPAMILMSIAMQESHCNAKTHGPNGEIGMMQLTPDNCKEGGHSVGEAWDPHVNIKLAAKQFQGYLDGAKGNVLAALGQYNGWKLGMTEGQAKSEKYGCFAQNNLDYLDSTVNGWLQGKDGYSKQFKTYNNLAHCGNHE